MSDSFEAEPTPVGGGTIPHRDLMDYLYAVRRRWWIVGGAGVAATAAAWVALMGQQPVYTAEALLRMAGSSTLVAVGLTAPTMEEPADFGTQVEIIRSRAVLADVVDSLGLQLRFTGRGDVRSRIVEAVEIERDAPPGAYVLDMEGGKPSILDPATEAVLGVADETGRITGPGFKLQVKAIRELAEGPAEFVVNDRQRALEWLRRQVQVEPGKGVGLIRIRFSDLDPVHAASVVNGIAVSYAEYRGRVARESAGGRREFLAEQLVQLADSLRRAEDAFLLYQEAQGLLDPQAEGGALATALVEGEEELRALRSQEAMLAALDASLRNSEADVATVERSVASARELLPGGVELYGRLQGLATERGRLTASRFGHTEASPEVETVDSLLLRTTEEFRILAGQTLNLVSERRSGAQQRVSGLRQQVGNLPQRTAEFTRLQQRVNAVQTIYDLLVERYYEAQIAEAVETGDVELVDAAPVPLRPEPGPRRTSLAIAFVVGSLLGLGGVGLGHYTDTTVRRAEDAEVAAQLRVLARVPRIEAKAHAEAPSRLLGVEAFRTLVTNLRFACPDPVIAITSAAPAEGKSTVAANLALAFGQQGFRCVLVDADFRRPVVDSVFQVDASPGLTDAIGGAVKPDGAIRELKDLGIDVIPAGTPQPNPLSLLSGKEMARLLMWLRSRYEVVILDTPPVLAVSDVSALCPLVDGMLLTVWANKTDRLALREAVEQLRHFKGRLLGLVLTSMPKRDRDARRRYGYYQYSAYHTDVARQSRVEAGARRRARLLRHGS